MSSIDPAELSDKMVKVGAASKIINNVLGTHIQGATVENQLSLFVITLRLTLSF
jgi:hypothetical protein